VNDEQKALIDNVEFDNEIEHLDIKHEISVLKKLIKKEKHKLVFKSLQETIDCYIKEVLSNSISHSEASRILKITRNRLYRYKRQHEKRIH